MQLLTKHHLKRFNQVWRQEEAKDPIVILKLFNPSGSQSWYCTEYNEEDGNFFCYVTGMHHDEWGYTSLSELQSLKCPPFGLGIERDLHFEECPISNIIKS